MHARRTSLCPFIRIIIRHDVFKRADVRVGELSEVRLDVVVEVYFDDGEFGFVGEAAGGAVVPVYECKSSCVKKIMTEGVDNGRTSPSRQVR